MDNRELIEKWLSVFGEGVDKKLIEDHVTSDGNHLWHLFSWGDVSCLEGDEARKAFDDLQYTEAIRFYDGYSNRVEGISAIEKISAKEIDKDKESDVYIVAKDFSWTYVRTHEFNLGPYLCRKNLMKEFRSEYANVRWIEEDQVVFLEWLKAAHLDNYRQPTSFALQLLRDHPGSNFVIDARNGFEDDKRDVEWGFQYLLPEMSKTSCGYICFIMNQVNDIEEEMDMWTLEFKKYFEVIRVETYEQAIESLQVSKC